MHFRVFPNSLRMGDSTDVRPEQPPFQPCQVYDKPHRKTNRKECKKAHDNYVNTMVNDVGNKMKLYSFVKSKKCWYKRHLRKMATQDEMPGGRQRFLTANSRLCSQKKMIHHSQT